MTDSFVLQAVGIAKSFGSGPTVLGPCDLEVRHEEVIAIVGPSGSGKTTLLQAIAGLTSLDSGFVQFEGGLLKRPSPRISVVPQDYGLFPWRTALRNVEFPLEVARIPRRDRRQRAREALNRVGLSEAIDKFPHQLSGGMRQRTAIARAIVAQPTLLLLDEPMSALDVVTKRAMQRQLAQLVHEVHLSTVIVTHDLTDAVRMADRAVILAGKPGRIVADCRLDRSLGENELLEFLSRMIENSGTLATQEWGTLLAEEQESRWVLQ